MNTIINLNGELIPVSNYQLSVKNRGFKYGDGLFETIKIIDQQIVFLEDHYFRLMASMRMLRMEIPMEFNMSFFESAIISVVKSNELSNARCRMTVWREAGGLYFPDTNNISFLVEVSPLSVQVKESYSIDLFRDYYVNSGLLSTLKTNNKLINVLAGIYAKENDLENSVLLNERKQVVELTNGNVFMVSDNSVITPPISDGCIKGIVRKKLIELINRDQKYELKEASISPFDLQKTDELFMTNSIVGIQPITKYKKKLYSKEITLDLIGKLNQLI